MGTVALVKMYFLFCDGFLDIGWIGFKYFIFIIGFRLRISIDLHISISYCMAYPLSCNNALVLFRNTMQFRLPFRYILQHRHVDIDTCYKKHQDYHNKVTIMEHHAKIWNIIVSIFTIFIKLFLHDQQILCEHLAIPQLKTPIRSKVLRKMSYVVYFVCLSSEFIRVRKMLFAK